MTEFDFKNGSSGREMTSRGSITRGLKSFCADYARIMSIIKVHSLINKITFKRQMGIHSMSKR